MCCYAMHEDDVYCLKAIVREKDTASARASRLSTAVQVTYIVGLGSRKKIVTIVTYKTFSVITNVDVFYPAIKLFIRIVTRRRCRRPQAQNHLDLAVLTLGGLTHPIIYSLLFTRGDFKKVIEAKSTRFIFQPKSVPGPRRKSGKGRKKQVNVLYCRGPHDILSSKASYISGRGHARPYTLILTME